MFCELRLYGVLGRSLAGPEGGLPAPEAYRVGRAYDVCMIVDSAIYVDGRRAVEPASLQETYEACREQRGVAWIGLYEPTEEELSSVGTMAGQVVMQGFINRRIPLFLRRLITMLPALVILAIGVNPSRSLVISQVVLSFGIPFALIPLLIHCRNRQVMGALVNRPATTAIATVVVTLIVSLNVFLLYQTFFG